MACNTYIGREIGNSIGHTEEVDLEDEEIKWGEYMRVRVKLDISKPLLKKKKLAIEEFELMWVSFSYEKLPDYCYGCLVIGHRYKECKV